MRKIDIDEENIYDMLSKITVDSSRLTGQIKRGLHKDIPNRATNQGRRRWQKTIAVAMVMSMVLVVTIAAGVMGKFDWFIEKFNPAFGDVIESVETYSEDQGIRMEVIGAQKYDNKAIIYLSLQDITGQNRLTKRTSFRDGFSVKMNENEQGGTGFSYTEKVIYFEKQTNTVYYEFNITTASASPLADTMVLDSFLVYFNTKEYEEEPISISLAEVGVAKTTSIQQAQIWGGSRVPTDLASSIQVLMPSIYAKMPHGEEDQWISNIGIIDGKLHVQIGKIFNKEFGSVATLLLKNTQGEIINSDYTLTLLGNEQNEILDIEKNDYAHATYRYEEAVFDIDINNLREYILCFTGSVSTGVEGRWNVRTNLNDSTANIRVWKNDTPVEGHLFEHITLSPLGLQATGSYEGQECYAGDMSIEVETTQGVIRLRGGGGGLEPENHTFDYSWDTRRPFDVSKVTAIIINDTRIPIN